MMNNAQLVKAFSASAIALIIAAYPVSGFAATQGSLGVTSTGSATISVTKTVQAQISDIADMTLSNWGVGDGAVTLYSNVCVYSSTGSYKVTASGSGTANAFTIASGSNTVPYTVTWNSGGAGNLASTGNSLTAGSLSSSFNNASMTSATCSGGGANDTARVVVGITQANMNSAVASATPYTGTLTMVVAPF